MKKFDDLMRQIESLGLDEKKRNKFVMEEYLLS